MLRTLIKMLNFMDTLNKTNASRQRVPPYEKLAGKCGPRREDRKKAYAILEPTISHLTGNKAHHGVMKALNGDKDIRHKIISGHNQIEDHVKNVSSKFKKAGLNIGM